MTSPPGATRAEDRGVQRAVRGRHPHILRRALRHILQVQRA
jgi:hypothetical protein